MERPRIKDMHTPVRLDEKTIRIGSAHFGVAAEIEDDDTSTVWSLLALLDGTRTTSEIVEEALRRDPRLDADSVRDGIATLVEDGFIEDAGARPPSALTAAERERYDRSADFYAWVDSKPRPSRWEVQRRLKQARVTVLGLGGIGSAVAASLAASGIGALHCVDFDVLEASNLNRQLLYREGDLGGSKVERAIEQLRHLNSFVEVSGEELRIGTGDDLVPLLADCDLFILCADRPEPRQILTWTSDAAVKTKTPWITSF
ncbi:MAG TPA: ThiF family adenylyltransferase [Gaiellaceae bacterium]